MGRNKLTALQRLGAPGLVLIIGLGFSFAFFNELLEQDRNIQEETFREAARQRLSAVEKRISSELTVLRSIVGFYQGSNFVDSQEFRSFIDTVLTSGRSFQALEWIPRIPAAERESYVQKARDNGYANFFIKEKNAEGKMVPAGPREEYFPVYYVEPYAGNEGAHGFDLASNEIRLKALRQARDTGSMVASSRINLVQLKENNAGVLVFAPIFRKNSAYGTLAERRKTCQASPWALSGFHALFLESSAKKRVTNFVDLLVSISMHLKKMGTKTMSRFTHTHHAPEKPKLRN